MGATLRSARRSFPRRSVRLLPRAGRIIAVRTTLPEPSLPAVGNQARPAQHAPSLAAHYSATELIAAGVDVRTVAGRLGHGSGGATTLKVYAAWVDEADRRAATTMASIMPAPVAAACLPRSSYEVIAAGLRDRITRGELGPGDQLPMVADLAAKHAVAVGTAHRALDLLRQERLIVVSRGRRATVIG